MMRIKAKDGFLLGLAEILLDWLLVQKPRNFSKDHQG